jgi:6-phosphogluconolactonase (cycloisomerase 2 family)
MSAPLNLRRNALNLVLVVLLALVGSVATILPAFAEDTPGAVYVLTNAAGSNAVEVFDRAADGMLTPAGSYATGGQGIGGTGAALGSQGALALSDNGQWLFAVNAGSNDISVFAVSPASGLALVDRAPSGGLQPISITSYHDLVYVLNAGGSGNIAGFRLDQNGALTPIANSTRPLSGSATNPAEVKFSRDGRVLAVTEKATNIIDTYAVDSNGYAGQGKTFPSPGATPFGFDWGLQDTLVVTEAPGSAASSYTASADGTLKLVSTSVPDKGAAACWLAITNSGSLAFAANAGTSTISTYRVRPDGSIGLAIEVAASVPGRGAIDLGLSHDSQYLYQLSAGSQSKIITGYRVASDGSLNQINSLETLPLSAVGVVAR